MARVQSRINFPRVKRTRNVKVQRSIASRPYARTATGSTRRAGRVTGLSRNDRGFPDRLRTNLVYGDVLTLTSTAGARAVNTFRLNSLFDPDYTQTGHQPQWYDQYTAIYGQYRVLGAKIRATFVPQVNATGETLTGPLMVGVTTSNDSTFTATQFSNLIEDGNSNNGIVVCKTGGNNMRTINNTFSIERDIAVGSYDDATASLTNTSPIYQFFAHVWMVPMSSLTGTQYCSVQIEIDFRVEFSRRIEGVIS